LLSTFVSSQTDWGRFTFAICEEMNNSTNDTSSINQTKQGSTSLSDAERHFKIIFYFCLFIAGSLGNLLVIAVVKAKRKKTINDYFILNLAVSDLTFLWLSLPFYTYELFQTFYKSVFYCKLIWPMMSVTLSVSVLTLTSMAVERCRGIINPFQPRIKLKATLVWILLIWVGAFVTMAPLMIVTQPDGMLCFEVWPNTYYRQTYTAVLFALQYAIPLIVIAIAYLRIAFRLITSKLPMRTSVNARGQVVRQKSRSENVQIIRTLAVIVILFMACMLPNQIAWMLFDFGDDSQRKLSHAFWISAEALIFLHACVNPIVYGTLTGQFRQGYVRYLRYAFGCCCRKTRIRSPDFSENRTRELPRRKSSGVIVHGSLKYKSFVNKSKSISFQTHCSPSLSITRESNSIYGGSSSARHRHNTQTLAAKVNKRNSSKTKVLLNLSFANSSLDISDEEHSVQETKL